MTDDKIKEYMEIFTKQHAGQIEHHINQLRAKGHIPDSIENEDLFSHGLHGLYSALRSYNHEGGSNLSTFAKNHIQGAIMSHVSKQHPVSKEIKNMIDDHKKKQEALSAQPVKEIKTPTPKQIPTQGETE